MANPLRDLLFGQINQKRDLVEALVPRRTFNDVILPPQTRRALDHALLQIKKHDLIFQTWGLAERHATGLGLAFNFAGPPGTGKTVCAEAIANALGKKLLVVRYSEMESLWAGETGKNVSAVFNAAGEQDAVLFFDEADAIAGRRFSSVTQGYQREANTVVNVLLKELESFDGVVIFATNLAANFDPAFERRVRTHILFEMPGAPEREQIWKVQLHARKTPLAPDVDFKSLAEKYKVSGGDIKNAVLKAAQMATAEPGPDADKKIHQRHFETGVQDVLQSKKVMEQSIFADGDGSHSSSATNTALAGLNGAWNQLSTGQESLNSEVAQINERLGEGERRIAALPGIVERFDDAARASLLSLRAEVVGQIEPLTKSQRELTDAQLELTKSQREIVDAQRGFAQAQHDLGETQRHLETQLPALQTAVAQLPQIKESTAQIGAHLESLRVQNDEHRVRLEDLFGRVSGDQEVMVRFRQETDEKLNRLKRACFALAFSAAMVALAALIVSLAMRG